MRDLLIDLGIVSEIDSAFTVPCDGCAEGHLLEVDVCEYPTGTVGRAKCPECGRVTVPLDRLRLWALSVDGLVRAVEKNIGATGGIETIAIDRLFAVGAVSEGRNRRDVFFGRGMTWDDADNLVRSSSRLRAASKPVLLVPAFHPTTTAFAEMGMAVISLAEIVQVQKRRIVFDRRAVLNQSPAHVDEGDDADSGTLALSDVDMAVLEVLAERPHDTKFIDDIVVASGFGKTAVKEAIKRLQDAKLIGRPAGTKRQGLSITEEGLRIVKNAKTKGPSG